MSIKPTDWIPVEMAAHRAGVSFATVYDAIRKGKIKMRVEMVQRRRVRLKDVRAYKAQMNPAHIERGKKGMRRRWEELAKKRMTAKEIPRPSRKMVNHPGPKKSGSTDTYSTEAKEAP